MRKVYLISSEIDDTKHYKIGYTKREVSERIRELKTGNCGVFEIIKVYKPKDFAVNIEKSLHRHFSTKKVNGEWFELSDEDVESFEDLCEKFYETFHIIQENNTYLDEINYRFK